MKPHWIVLLCIFSITACAARNPHTDDDLEETEHRRFPWLDLPLSHVIKEYRPPFNVDPTKPFLIIFGRGSAMEGFNTIEINEQGIAILYRLGYEEEEELVRTFGETGTLHLSSDRLKVLGDSINSFQLTALHKEYHANVYDGSQWQLWIEQGAHEKSVYCNNHFPESIYKFSNFLDEFLIENGLGDITWTEVPAEAYRKHLERLSEIIN